MTITDVMVLSTRWGLGSLRRRICCRSTWTSKRPYPMWLRFRRRSCGETTLTGTPDEVLERAAQWRDCGVRYMVLTNGGPLQRSLRKGLLSLQPFSKIIRGLKKL